MSGHNKWSKIKRQKEKTDGQKSKIFSKMIKLITAQAKIAGGNVSSPGLRAAIEKAKSMNVPSDNIERAVKKFAEGGLQMEPVTFEAYGPGGCGIIVEALTDSKNRTTQEIKLILSHNDLSLAGMGSVAWAFSHTLGEDWIPTTSISISEEDGTKLSKLVDELEDNDDVQDVFTNAE